MTIPELEEQLRQRDAQIKEQAAQIKELKNEIANLKKLLVEMAKSKEAKPPNDRPLELKPPPYPLQIGSMNTGYRPADALIDDLRISSGRRYDGLFVPARPLDGDNRTLALFHFDGDLNAETPAGCRAIPGPVQSSNCESCHSSRLRRKVVC